MNLFNKYLGISTAGILIFGNLLADNYDDSETTEFEPLEHETLMYQAEMMAKGGNEKDINKLAQDAVDVCYNAYKNDFDRAIAQEKEKLAGMGASNSSAAKLIPVEYSKKFATVIINQIDSLAQKLSANDKNVFWNASEQHIKKVLGNYCLGHGASSTVALNEHIENLIKLKKTFG